MDINLNSENPWQAAAESLALPIYAELTEDQQAWVVEGIRSCYLGHP